MKHLLASICLLWMATNAIAQKREIIPVDWQQVKKEVTDNPQHVKDLIARLSADQIDTTLTRQERILAFYGQSFLTNDTEEELAFDLNKLSKEKSLHERLSTAKKMLGVNPLNLNALMSACNILLELSEDSVSSKESMMAEAEKYFDRAMRIFSTIAKTGDGSEAHPFYVTKISDEYCFMRYYLELWEYKMQWATACCDVIALETTSKYYSKPTIHFEISRVYELEHQKFSK